MARPTTEAVPDGADRAAKAVLEATVAGDKATCDKYGITRRTLQRWRKAIGTERHPKKRQTTFGNLTENVAAKKAELEVDWAADIGKTLKAVIGAVLRSTDPDNGADIKDPDVIHALAGALKILSEVSSTWKLLDVRIRRAAGQTGTAAGPAVSGGTVVPLRPTGTDSGSGTAAAE